MKIEVWKSYYTNRKGLSYTDASGIWCVVLKIALPYVADNKKKFTNKNASSLQSSVITNRIRVCATRSN